MSGGRAAIDDSPQGGREGKAKPAYTGTCRNPCWDQGFQTPLWCPPHKNSSQLLSGQQVPQEALLTILFCVSRAP